MHFKIETTPIFLEFLSPHIAQIKASPGCSFLQILRDIHQPTKIITLSHWESEEHLDNYRHSELFQHVWDNTKLHFSAPPEAWSLNEIP